MINIFEDSLIDLGDNGTLILTIDHGFKKNVFLSAKSKYLDDACYEGFPTLVIKSAREE
jgi:hypothetical protein